MSIAADRRVDAGVARHQPAIPGLPVLLDDDRLTALLHERGWLATGERARADRLRLKSGTRAQAAVRTDPGGRWLLASAYTTCSWDKARKDRREALRRGWASLVDADLLLVVTPMLADRDLRALRDLRPDDPAGLRRRTTAVLASAGVDGWAGAGGEGAVGEGAGGVGRQGIRSRTIGYNPARRWVGVLHAESAAADGPGGSPAPLVVVKVHADHRTGEHAAGVASLLAAAGLTTPAAVPLPAGVVVTPWVHGRQADSARTSDAEAVAGTLARLSVVRCAARTSTPSLRFLHRLRHRDILHRAEAAAAALTVLDPAAGVRARAVLAGLAPLLSTRVEDPVLVHGDLSRDQVLIGPRGPVLLDLDRAALGPRGWDAASWLAAQAADGTPVDRLAALPGICVPGHLLAAAALLRTPEPWRRRRPGHAAATGALLDLAEAAVRGVRPADGATA